MSDFNQKEYQTVILAALLHDIGKFTGRVNGARGKHPILSAEFVNSDLFRESVSNEVRKEWIDDDLLETLVQRHHEYSRDNDQRILVQDISDSEPHKRALAYIVSRADSCSSGERDNRGKSRIFFRKARLMSILSRVDIGKSKGSHKFYSLCQLEPSKVFPTTYSRMQVKDEYKGLVDAFMTEVKKFKPEKFDRLFNGYLSLLHEFLWCVASDTTIRYRDISLFDHLSTSSAIAACLYHYHCNDMDETKVINTSVKKFRLVAGDLSGIQKFIFEIGSTNPKKLSKILRGRSFYLSMLTDLASLKILRRLNLPLSCRIMNAAGRFVLLVPNTDLATDELTKVNNEIEEYIYKKFLGKLSLNISVEVLLTMDDFKLSNFSRKYREMRQAVETARKKRFQSIIREGRISEPMRQAFDAFRDNNSACDFCRVYPKEPGEERCGICRTSEALGKGLATNSNQYLYIYENEGDESSLFPGFDVSFGKKGENWILQEKIGNVIESNNPGYMRRYLARHLPKPRPDDIDKKSEIPLYGNSLCRYCGSRCSIKAKNENNSEASPLRKDLVKEHLTFQCMSASSPRDNRGKGVDHLAVLKADMDDTGVVFSQGLRDNFSISRYATLSRTVNFFFTGWLPNEIERNFPMTYTVYAGGDDLLIIGPWEEIIKLGASIGEHFRAFVGKNQNLTLSAGINLIRPSSPIGLATQETEELLQRSKLNPTKDSITLFATTVTWDEFPKLREFMTILNAAFNEPGAKVNSSFLYRLLKYHEMFKASEAGLIEGLKFHSAMNRDVERNIVKTYKGKIVNAELIARLKPLYFIEKQKNFNPKLMSNIKIPVFWTLYKNRGGGQ